MAWAQDTSPRPQPPGSLVWAPAQRLREHRTLALCVVALVLRSVGHLLLLLSRTLFLVCMEVNVLSTPDARTAWEVRRWLRPRFPSPAWPHVLTRGTWPQPLGVITSELLPKSAANVRSKSRQCFRCHLLRAFDGACVTCPPLTQ